LESAAIDLVRVRKNHLGCGFSRQIFAILHLPCLIQRPFSDAPAGAQFAADFLVLGASPDTIPVAGTIARLARSVRARFFARNSRGLLATTR
jgi:hypothetical protein